MRLLTLVSCAGLSLIMSTVATAQSLQGNNLWLRESVPGAENGAGFGILHNTSTEDLVIISASSPAAVDVEIHTHVHHHGGQMAMEQIDALPVSAGESVELRPGGYHLMLMQLKQPLRTGDVHPVTLTLDSGEKITFDIEVKPLIQD